MKRNWQGGHFHISQGAQHLPTFLLPTLSPPTPCCCVVSAAGQRVRLRMPPQMREVISGLSLVLCLRSVPAITYPTRQSPKHSSFCFSTSSLTMGFPNTSPVPTGCPSPSSLSQKTKGKRNSSDSSVCTAGEGNRVSLWVQMRVSAGLLTTSHDLLSFVKGKR